LVENYRLVKKLSNHCIVLSTRKAPIKKPHFLEVVAFDFLNLDVKLKWKNNAK